LNQKVLEKTIELTRTNQDLKASQIAIMRMMEDAVEARNALEITNANLLKEIAVRQKAEESLLLKNFVFNDSIAANSIADINGVITEVNNSFLKMWGYTDKNDVTGKPITHFLFDEADSLQIITALQCLGEWEGDYTARRKDGSIFIAHGLATLIKDEKGKSIGYQSAVLDFTEKRKQEEIIQKLNEELEAKVLQRTEQLEAANKELEAFSYSVSHDLRAPLRAVNSYISILLEDYEKTLDEEGKRICGIISSSAKQMGELINDLLSFSRIGRSIVEPELIDMKLLVNNVCSEVFDEKLRDRTKLELGKLSKAYGDTNLIRIVWTNLISNAIKYSSNKPFSEIIISSRREDHTITYSVKDNGVGFDMLYKHKLFGVFQRLHSEKDFEGNGVGLAIVQRIINKHGGKVWAEGEVDKGATFYFSLPVF
ncbi:MAG: PAS domain S-box protein, partial [Bacteroidales bacterium]|nr:PAS domain S-box protein [Bacteroidales bacterium]